ncbi:hypothetical protein bcere0025_58430 [Bacillus cereus F65185]|nr:hypothetical protein bcere0025_58430 [Bacillus cereus F65185]
MISYGAELSKLDYPGMLNLNTLRKENLNGFSFLILHT